MKTKLLVLFLFFLSTNFNINIFASEKQVSQSAYNNYKKRYDSLKNKDSILANGFNIIEKHVFNVNLNKFGKVTFYPIFDKQTGIFFFCLVNQYKRIVYKTDYIEYNNLIKEKYKLNSYELVSVSFKDANSDGLKDIFFIFKINYKDEFMKEFTEKSADVLFQTKDGFYSDLNINDALNSYSMNQNIETISEYLNKEKSKKFLYTSRTLNELLDNGFKIIKNKSDWVDFEEFGRVKVVVGTYSMGGLTTLMVYLIDIKDNIAFVLKPQKNYDSMVEFKDIFIKDANGNNLKDIIIIAEYRNCEDYDTKNFFTIQTIYYQEMYWFYTVS